MENPDQFWVENNTKVREIMREPVGLPSAPQNLGQSIHDTFAALGGLDLPSALRSPVRPMP